MAVNFPEFPFANLDMKKIFGDLKLPTFDAETLLAASKRNVEALTEANRLAFEGYQAVAKRQVEIMRETMSEASVALRDAVGTGSADPAKGPEILKKAFETALANMRELAELSAKANGQAFEVIQKRVEASIAEIKDAAGK